MTYIVGSRGVDSKGSFASLQARGPTKILYLAVLVKHHKCFYSPELSNFKIEVEKCRLIMNLVDGQAGLKPCVRDYFAQYKNPKNKNVDKAPPTWKIYHMQ